MMLKGSAKGVAKKKNRNRTSFNFTRIMTSFFFVISTFVLAIGLIRGFKVESTKEKERRLTKKDE